jgi:hypothetical protein
MTDPTAITDEFMQARLAQAKPYTVVLLRAAAGYHDPASRPLVWEHGRRNMALNADGPLAVVLPVADDSELCGVAVFTTDPERTAELMDADPAVQAGVFSYEVHPVRGFPGSTLP